MVKPTVHDIARQAGVSLATVDRVLNARPGVRDKTVARVETAIRDLGYVRDLTAANLARRRLYRLVFILPAGPSRFVETIQAAVDEASLGQMTDRVHLITRSVPMHDPHALAGLLAGLCPKSCDGVALMAPESPQVRDAVARLRTAGVPVVALVSDLPQSDCDHFVGIDNDAAGRTAARLMGRFLASSGGQVLVVGSSMRARDSLERRFGFDSLLTAEFPSVQCLPTIESHDDPVRMIANVRRALATRPEVVGVYSLSTGNDALLCALRTACLPQRPVVIAHELTTITRLALQAGEIDAVITQNTGHLVRSAIRVLQARCDGRSILESQERIRIEIILRESALKGQAT